ncbi:J domain-containing protein [Sporobolomyces koalae]|uniref:J domain-containing protein n=1 Tax=Sporobolomyces koalae TaxID=500713 RepID=UPI00316D6EDE
MLSTPTSAWLRSSASRIGSVLPPTSTMRFARTYAAPSVSADQDHYTNLGIPPNATRKQIRDKFYELSRKYHPDAPSTSSMTPEERTQTFQQLSQSYSVLSDPALRKSYDLSRGGGGAGGPGHHRGRSRHHAGYTRGSGGMGYAPGNYGSNSTNDERRQSANYAWQHPQRGRAGANSQQQQYEQAANSRPDPFAQRSTTSDDHLERFAKRARMRHEQTMKRASAHLNKAGQTSNMAADSHYRAGTAVFGAAKAEEESRLINDSSTKRSSQVLFVFGSVFVLAWLFSGGHNRHESSNNSRRRT